MQNNYFIKNNNKYETGVSSIYIKKNVYEICKEVTFTCISKVHTVVRLPR